MTDAKTFRLVIQMLGATLLLCVAGVVALNLLSKPADDLLKQLAVGALTALGALLARTPTDDRPAPVTVENAPADPIPVEGISPQLAEKIARRKQ